MASEPTPTRTTRETAFAERLRVELARRQMTQRQLGGLIGRTQTAVSYWSTGRRSPSLGDLCRVATALDVTTDYLLGREGTADA